MVLSIDRVTLRKMSIEDVPIIHNLINIEEWDFDLQDIERILEMDPDSSLVACLDERVIGGLTAVANRDRCIIGHVVVQKDCRGIGMGDLLMSTVLKNLDSRGIEYTELFSEPDAIQFYNRYGFRKIENISLNTSHLESRIFSSRISDNVRQISSSDFEEVLRLDREIFGYDREIIIQKLIRDFPELSFGLFEGDDLIGFVQGRFGPTGNDVGPLIMASQDRAAAVNLLHGVLSKLEKKKTYVITLSENELARGILREFGFREDYLLVRLIRSERNVRPYAPGVLALSSTELG